MEEIPTTSKIDWNLSEIIANEIGRLLILSNSSYLKGDINKMFFCLKAVKMRFIQNLNKEERLTLKKQEVNICKEMQPKNKNKSKIMELIEEYNEQILDYLEKYDFLFKKKEDHKKMF